MGWIRPYQRNYYDTDCSGLYVYRSGRYFNERPPGFVGEAAAVIDSLLKVVTDAARAFLNLGHYVPGISSYGGEEVNAQSHRHGPRRQM